MESLHSNEKINGETLITSVIQTPVGEVYRLG